MKKRKKHQVAATSSVGTITQYRDPVTEIPVSGTIGIVLTLLALNVGTILHYRDPIVAREIMLGAHLKWLESGGVKGERANLYKADLSYAILYKANLYKADLSKAYLYKADLSNAYLSEANLSNANLSEANLSEANLSYARLFNAYLFEALGLNVCKEGCK